MSRRTMLMSACALWVWFADVLWQHLTPWSRSWVRKLRQVFPASRQCCRCYWLPLVNTDSPSRYVSQCHIWAESVTQLIYVSHRPNHSLSRVSDSACDCHLSPYVSCVGVCRDIVLCCLYRILLTGCTRIQSESSACQIRRTHTSKWIWTRSGWFRRRPSIVDPSGLHLQDTVCADVFVRWFSAARLLTSMDRLSIS